MGCLQGDAPRQPVAADPPAIEEGPRPTAVPAGATVVTLLFSDTKKTQTKAGALLAKYGVHGTFYLNSVRISRGPVDLTLEDVKMIAAAGNEIGSHTIDHEDLSGMSQAELRHQICDDRAALMALGFSVTSFEYPMSSDTPEARQVVIDCNFNDAHITGGIHNPYGCSSCPLVETIPPRDVYLIHSPASVKDFWTLDDLKGLVLQAENAGGGWMIFNLHDICDGCGTYSIKEPVLDAFLAWLVPRSSRGTYVLTMHDVIGGAVKPPVYSDGGTFPFDAGVFDAGTPDAGTPDAGTPDAGTPDGGADGGTGGPNLLRNESLETDVDSDNVPDCWKRVNVGSTSGGWSRTSDAHSGSWAQTARISSLSSGGDRRLIVLQDSGNCAPAVTPGHTYRVSAWYKTSGTAVFVASYRTASGWVEWATSPVLPTRSTYARAEWTLPAVPSGALNLSVGLSLRSATTLTMDDFSLMDVTP